MPTLNVEEYQFRDDGILLNGDDLALPFVDVTRVEGLDTAPYRTQTKDQEGTDGGFVDAQFETLRTVVLDLDIYADPNALDTYLDDLKENFEPNEDYQPLYWRGDNGDRVVFGKSQGLKYSKTKQRSWGMQPATITILCGDPRIYSPEIVSSGPIILGTSAVGGRGYPKGFPFGYGGVATQGAGSITPGGNRSTPGWYVLTGPITNPIIINDTLGLQWTFTIALATGEELWINPKNLTVRLGEFGPSRRTNMKGPWWYLLKGENSFRLQGSGGTGATKLEVFARPAWR
jgi:hypothetical protein